MATTYDVSTSRLAVTPTRVALGVIANCRTALREWNEGRQLQARLSDLSDMELQDIGISRGEIYYVITNRDVDPRGVRSAG